MKQFPLLLQTCHFQGGLDGWAQKNAENEELEARNQRVRWKKSYPPKGECWLKI